MKGPDDRPLLLLDRKGEGRVGMLLSDQGWLWARGFEGGGPHVALYRRIAHWLMKEPELEEERLTADGRGMTLDVRRQTMSDDPGPAQVITPSGKTMTVPLAASRARRLHRQRRDQRDRPLPGRQWRPDRACPCRPGQRAGIRRHGLHRERAASRRPKRPAAACAGWHRPGLGPASSLPGIVPVRGAAQRLRQRLDRPAHHRRQRAEVGLARAAVRRLLRPRPAAACARLDVVPRGAVEPLFRSPRLRRRRCPKGRMRGSACLQISDLPAQPSELLSPLRRRPSLSCRTLLPVCGEWKSAAPTPPAPS